MRATGWDDLRLPACCAPPGLACPARWDRPSLGFRFCRCGVQGVVALVEACVNKEPQHRPTAAEVLRWLCAVE